MSDYIPAFPTTYDHRDHGMSLRDYFAGQALAGICAAGSTPAQAVADVAYDFANAMLVMREKVNAQCTDCKGERETLDGRCIECWRTGYMKLFTQCQLRTEEREDAIAALLSVTELVDDFGRKRKVILHGGTEHSIENADCKVCSFLRSMERFSEVKNTK